MRVRPPFFALVFLILIIPVTGSEGPDWKDYGSITLKWGETVNVSGYNITALDFRPGTIEETKNETKCLVENDPAVRRIVGCDDWVLLTVFKNNVEVLDTALAKRNITIEGADFYNETTYQLGDETLKIKAEDVVTGNNIPTPYAVIRVFTKKNEEIMFDIAKNLTIKKIVSPEVYVTPSWPLVYVTLDVENIGSMNFSIIDVVDQVPADFKIEPAAELNWRLSLQSGQKWQTIYSIRPLYPAAGRSYSLPEAKLFIIYGRKQYDAGSGNSTFVLLSSDIILTKTTDRKAVKAGDNLTVLVGVKNNGSRASLVKVRDSIPKNAEIVGGGLNFSMVLQPGMFHNNSYVIRINNASGNISIPAAELTFREYKPGYDPDRNPHAITGNATSLAPVIMVGTMPVSPASAPSQSADSAAAAKTENVEKREEAGNRQEGGFIDGIMKKMGDLWSFIRNII